LGHSITLDGSTDMIRTLRTSWGTQAIDYSWANLDVIQKKLFGILTATFRIENTLFNARFFHDCELI